MRKRGWLAEMISLRLAIDLSVPFSAISTTMTSLASVIDSLPLIDNHTHQIGKGYSHYGLRGAFTEAAGEATADVVHSLVWKRSMRELGKLLVRICFLNGPRIVFNFALYHLIQGRGTYGRSDYRQTRGNG